MVPTKIQDLCEPRWGILWRQEDKFPSRTCLVGDIFDTAGKIIDLNKFKTDILDDAIEESQNDFEDTRDGKGGLRKSKIYHMKIGLNGKTAYTNTLRQGKTVVV